MTIKKYNKRVAGFFTGFIKRVINKTRRCLSIDIHFVNIHFGRHLGGVPENGIVVFPLYQSVLCCGISGIVAINKKKTKIDDINPGLIADAITKIDASGYTVCKKKGVEPSGISSPKIRWNLGRGCRENKESRRAHRKDKGERRQRHCRCLSDGQDDRRTRATGRGDNRLAR